MSRMESIKAGLQSWDNKYPQEPPETAHDKMVLDQVKVQSDIFESLAVEHVRYLLSIIEEASFKSKVLASHCGYCLGSNSNIEPNNAFEKSQEIFEILTPEWRESEEKRITQELIDGKHKLIYGSSGDLK